MLEVLILCIHLFCILPVNMFWYKIEQYPSFSCRGRHINKKTTLPTFFARFFCSENADKKFSQPWWRHQSFRDAINILCSIICRLWKKRECSVFNHQMSMVQALIFNAQSAIEGFITWRYFKQTQVKQNPIHSSKNASTDSQ